MATVCGLYSRSISPNPYLGTDYTFFISFLLVDVALWPHTSQHGSTRPCINSCVGVQKPFWSRSTGSGLIHQVEPHWVKRRRPLIGSDPVIAVCSNSALIFLMWLVCSAVCCGRHPSETCQLRPVLVTNISTVVRLMQRLMSFSDVMMCCLLLATVGPRSPFSHPSLLYCLLCQDTLHVGSPRMSKLNVAANGEYLSVPGFLLLPATLRTMLPNPTLL